MAYNMGPGFLNNGVWPKFVAAAESTRQGIGDSRNRWTRNRLLAATARSAGG
ncbi:MAG: hypothetical protein NTV86_14055 [Planctomycetota bacterium]|nr:hypothetical protein [Planctomycetota bacterium]